MLINDFANMPDEATDPRYVVLKSTAASLDFASTMAMAPRVFAKSESHELKNLGKTCLEAAKKAYAWAKANIIKQTLIDLQTSVAGRMILE